MSGMNIVLAGIGGYGGMYVKALLGGNGAETHAIAGAVDPYPDNSPYLEELKGRGIPVYPDLERFYAESGADLAIIASPIHYHGPQTCLALSRGSHVLCEKPLCASPEEARRMIGARDKAGKLAAVGYQWSYSDSIQAVKRDIRQGLFGKPLRLRTIVLWPRTAAYYARSWAGRISDGRGSLILDSVAGNATAHYIHNMFDVLGRRPDESARPARVTAELYRANAIENYDTAAMRAYTEDGAELLYYGSHAVSERIGAMFRYEFEHAELSFDDTDGRGEIVARFRSGESRSYGSPNARPDGKLWSVMAAARGEGPVLCGLEAAMSHTLCVTAMQRSPEGIAPFPESVVRRGAAYRENETITYVEGLSGQLLFCYEQAALPAELGFSWARRGREIRVE